MERVERLMVEVSQSAVDLKVFERVASELNQLQFLLDKDQDLPLTAQMCRRVDAASLRMDELMAEQFQQFLLKSRQNADDRNSLLTCLSIYASLNKVHMVEQRFSEVLVTNRLAEVLLLLLTDTLFKSYLYSDHGSGCPGFTAKLECHV